MLNLIHLLDNKAFEIILGWRVGWLENIFYLITLFGKSYIVVVITLVLTVYFWKKRDWEYIFPLYLLILISSVTTFVLKHFIARPRPVGMAVYIEDLSSFPSGHATVAIVLYGFLAYYLAKKTFGIKRFFAILSCILLILFIGFSRIYLGVHYLSDVVGGYLVGGVWLLIGIIYMEKTNK